MVKRMRTMRLMERNRILILIEWRLPNSQVETMSKKLIVRRRLIKNKWDNCRKKSREKFKMVYRIFIWNLIRRIWIRIRIFHLIQKKMTIRRWICTIRVLEEENLSSLCNRKSQKISAIPHHIFLKLLLIRRNRFKRWVIRVLVLVHMP